MTDVLLPFMYGVCQELEDKADLIILMNSTWATQPYRQWDIKSPEYMQGRVVRTKQVLVGDMNDISQRSGIFTRCANLAMPWLNSQPLGLGGRRDLIRQKGVFARGSRDEYDCEGTQHNGRNDPWLTFMVFTVTDKVRRSPSRTKYRPGTHIDPPWISVARERNG